LVDLLELACILVEQEHDLSLFLWGFRSSHDWGVDFGTSYVLDQDGVHLSRGQTGQDGRENVVEFRPLFAGDRNGIVGDGEDTGGGFVLSAGLRANNLDLVVSRVEQGGDLNR